ncbi:MAG: radical SAM protein, partial [Desulfovibrionaceae bacterium]|nr:radical SAM protein [Desulfovibrionaceae bacterium]
MQDFYSFSPLLKPETRHIYPVFIPFVGCRKRCVFCAQTLQTGRQAPASEQIEADLRNYLRAVGPSVSPDSELAFFGGTFTLLPQNLQRRLLELGGAVKSGGAELGEVCKGRFTALRCSTRPDAVSSVQLALLREYGVKTIELGVQSFDERSLRASDRGYAGENAFDACARVIKEGFELVVQLMPGMPGQSADAFRKDIERVVGLGPRAVRLYPCVVIEGTELARRWRAEEYRPWNLERTVDELSFALLRLNLAG